MKNIIPLLLSDWKLMNILSGTFDIIQRYIFNFVLFLGKNWTNSSLFFFSWRNETAWETSCQTEEEKGEIFRFSHINPRGTGETYLNEHVKKYSPYNYISVEILSVWQVIHIVMTVGLSPAVTVMNETRDENNFDQTLNHRSRTQLLFPSPVCYGPHPMSCGVVSFSPCLFNQRPLLQTESWHTVIWICTMNLTEGTIK